MTDTDKIELYLARSMALVAEVQDPELRSAIEMRMEKAHAEVANDAENLYRYTDERTG